MTCTPLHRFELEFRLLGPMVECYQRIGAHDLYVDTILRVLSKDCPASLVAEQPRFGDRLLTYASSDEVPVTCNADSVIAVEMIEEAQSSVGPVRRVVVRVRNCTATDLAFQGATLTVCLPWRSLKRPHQAQCRLCDVSWCVCVTAPQQISCSRARC